MPITAPDRNNIDPDTATQIDQNQQGDITVDFGNNGVDAVIGEDAKVALNPDGSVSIDFREMARDVDPGATPSAALDRLAPATPVEITQVTDAINALDSVAITVAGETTTINTEIPTDIAGEYTLNTDGTHAIAVQIDGIEGALTDEHLAAIQAVYRVKLLEQAGAGEHFSTIEVRRPETPSDQVNAVVILGGQPASEIRPGQNQNPGQDLSAEAALNAINTILEDPERTLGDIPAGLARAQIAHDATVSLNHNGEPTVQFNPDSEAARKILSDYGTLNPDGTVSVTLPPDLTVAGGSTEDIRRAMVAAGVQRQPAPAAADTQPAPTRGFGRSGVGMSAYLNSVNSDRNTPRDQQTMTRGVHPDNGRGEESSTE